MKRKRLIYIIPFVLLATPAITGCSVFEDGDINNYIGKYTVSVSYERVKHYYWGSSNIVSEKTPVPTGSTIIIHKDKKVEFTYNMGETIIGKTKVYKEYVKFSGLNFSSSYKFTLKDNHSLDYSYTENKYGVEYDYTTRRILFEYLNSVEE